jgi:hypothetical protein
LERRSAARSSSPGPEQACSFPLCAPKILNTATEVQNTKLTWNFACLSFCQLCIIYWHRIKKHVIYNIAYMLLKLIFLLLVVTTCVERVFTAMSLVRNKWKK